jgi:hypothetical protein
MKFVKIADYFKDNGQPLSKMERQKAQQVRDRINSFHDDFDIQQWLLERRQSQLHRQEDEKFFGIPVDAEIDQRMYHHKNRYYSGDPNAGKIASNSVAGKIKFMVVHFKVIIIAILVFVALLLLIALVLFVTGTLGSVGHTPFVLCGQDQIAGLQSVQLPNAKADQMAQPKYAEEVFISAAEAHNWKANAIVGVLSYIMQEGSGMGTFTYENYYMEAGPSGVEMDKTLDNKAWLAWLQNGKAKEEAHQAYYAKNSSSYYAAVGLGLLQESDVWRNDGSMDDTGATAMIRWCESKGKPWQDPQTQMDYYFQNVFTRSTAFDEIGVDPTKDNRTPEEWCRRVTAGIGMPALAYTDDNDYMTKHLSHIVEAKAAFSQFTGISVETVDEISQNLCSQTTDGMMVNGNSTLADAAVSLAATEKVGIPWDEDGVKSQNLQDSRLNLYRTEHVHLFPGDDYFASCDRAVAVAIRWSGVDKNFPAGDVSTQWNYLKSSKIFADVGVYGNVELKPGDILITQGGIGHIKIYVGNQAVAKRFAGSDADMYAASLHQYFPKVYKDSPQADKRTFEVFRQVK